MKRKAIVPSKKDYNREKEKKNARQFYIPEDSSKKKPQNKNVRQGWKVARKLQRNYKFKLQNQRFERGYM